MRVNERPPLRRQSVFDNVRKSVINRNSFRVKFTVRGNRDEQCLLRGAIPICVLFKQARTNHLWHLLADGSNLQANSMFAGGGRNFPLAVGPLSGSAARDAIKQ